MRPLDLLILAWRGLTRRPVRTLLTALGLGVAVAGLVVFLSLGEGVRQVFTAQFRSVGPDVQLTLDGAQSGLLPPPNLPLSVVSQVQAAATPLGAVRVTPVVTLLQQALDPAQSAVYYGSRPRRASGRCSRGCAPTGAACWTPPTRARRSPCWATAPPGTPG